MDEIAGRAVMLHGSADDPMATLRLTVRYRRPTPTSTPLTAVGWVEQKGGVGARVSGEIRLPRSGVGPYGTMPDGVVTAEGEALVAPPPEEFIARWEPEKSYWKVYE